MNTIRRSVEVLFESPIGNMNFVSYMTYVNTAGKITARSLMDLSTLALTYIEELERKNEQYEANFKEIESILSKLVEHKTAPIPDKFIDKKGEEPHFEGLENIPIDSWKTAVKPNGEPGSPPSALFVCPECNKEIKTKLALSSHMRVHKK